MEATTEVLDDGTVISYLMWDFSPATRETAEMVEIRYPDGSVRFGYPVPGDTTSSENGVFEKPTPGTGTGNTQQ